MIKVIKLVYIFGIEWVGKILIVNVDYNIGVVILLVKY